MQERNTKLNKGMYDVLVGWTDLYANVEGCKMAVPKI